MYNHIFPIKENMKRWCKKY